MFNRIIVPLDGSRLAETAIPYAARLAIRLEADLLLLRITTVKGVQQEDFVDEWQVVHKAEEYLGKVRDLLIESGHPWQLPPERVTTFVRFNPHKSHLLSQLPFTESDLVVIATHARTGLARLLHESHTFELLRDCGRPAIILQPANLHNLPSLLELLERCPLFKAGGENWPHRLILTLDGSAEAEAILAPPINLSEQLKISVTLLRISEPGDSMAADKSDYGLRNSQADMIEANNSRYQKAYNYLSPKRISVLNRGLNCSVIVYMGQPIEEITRYLNDSQAENSLLVMATHARSGANRLRFGSVAEGVLCRTHLPVMMQTIPPDELLPPSSSADLAETANQPHA